MPAGPIEDEGGMGAARDVSADLLQMELHGMGIDIGKRQPGADPTGRTDCAEQIGALVTLIGWLARARAASGPLAHDAVLLADPGRVFEPDLDRLALG